MDVFSLIFLSFSWFPSFPFVLKVIKIKGYHNNAFLPYKDYATECLKKKSYLE